MPFGVQSGSFIRKWYPDMYDKPILYTRAMRKYVREQAEEFKRLVGHQARSGFVVGRFISSFVDADTGELWEGAEEAESIRRVLNYRQCHITRMPMEDSGAFWNATIYSPRDPKMGSKLSLRLKGVWTHRFMVAIQASNLHISSFTRRAIRRAPCVPFLPGTRVAGVADCERRRGARRIRA